MPVDKNKAKELRDKELGEARDRGWRVSPPTDAEADAVQAAELRESGGDQ